MRYLLDTHVFIWLDSDPAKLSLKVAEICANPSHSIFLSLVSIWEMQIKIQIGKLKLPAPLADTIYNQVNTNRIQLLSLELSHILELENLENHHKDPFDRLLIAQSIRNNFTLLSDDAKIAQYPMQIMW